MAEKFTYVLNKTHHRQAWIKGDLEAEDIRSNIDVFNTRKDGNSELSRLESSAKRKGYKTRIKLVGRGNDSSILSVYTGNTWIHENTGEQHEEVIYYELIKKKM